MECERQRSKLSEYLDGALGPREAGELERHLAQCQGCRRERDALQRTVQAVRQLPRELAPSGLAARVMERVRAEALARAPVLALWPRALAVAAMLLLVVGVLLVLEHGSFSGAERGGERIAMSRQPTSYAKDAEEAAASAAREGRGVETARAAIPESELEKGGHARRTMVGKAAASLKTTVEDVLQRAVEGVAGEAQAPQTRELPLSADERVPPVALRPAEEGSVAGGTEIVDRVEGAPAPTAAGLGVSAKRAVAEGEVWKPGPETVPKAASGVPTLQETPPGVERASQRQRVMFNQVGVREQRKLETEREPDQILTVHADEPLELAERTIAVANENGIRDVSLVLAPGDEEGATQVELALRVPAVQYEEFLWQVSQVSPPREQRLSNTVVTGRETYFREVARRYNESQDAGAPGQARLAQPEAAKEDRGYDQPPVTEAAEGKEAGIVLRGMEVGQAAGVAPPRVPDRALAGRGDVNLLIRLVRRVARAAVAEPASDDAEAQPMGAEQQSESAQ